MFCRQWYLDEKEQKLWVDFWAVEPVGDFEADHFLGLLYADEALTYALARDQPEFISCTIMAMAGIFLPFTVMSSSTGAGGES